MNTPDMIEILNNHCNKENRLLLFNPPTGSGKTHTVLTWIFENYKAYCKENRKIFFVTNLKKNLPFDELRGDFFIPNKKLQEFEKDITLLDSNSDCLVKRFQDIENSINDYFKNHKVFYSRKNNVTEINRHKENNSLKTYVSKLKDELRTDFEPNETKHKNKVLRNTDIKIVS